MIRMNSCMDRSKELIGQKLVRNQESTIEKIAIFVSFLNIVSLYWLTKVEENS